jgi:L-ascorbate metabolism protein UlaG (beta-lactamase superfamily)
MEQVILSVIWFGQSCFLLQAGDTRILMDPIPPTMGYPVEATAASVVTISHEHFDHNYVELAKGNPAILRGLSEKGKDWNPIDFSNKDVKISAFPAYHDNGKGEQRGKNAMFLIETQGLRVLHTGDLGHPLDKETVKKIGKVDILMICVGGYYTIDATAAKEVTNELHPRVVIPMHYKTESTPKLPISGADDFLSGWKNVRRSKEARVGFTANLAGYPEGETTVLVLPYARPAAQSKEK